VRRPRRARSQAHDPSTASASSVSSASVSSSVDTSMEITNSSNGAPPPPEVMGQLLPSYTLEPQLDGEPGYFCVSILAPNMYCLGFTLDSNAERGLCISSLLRPSEQSMWYAEAMGVLVGDELIAVNQFAWGRRRPAFDIRLAVSAVSQHYARAPQSPITLHFYRQSTGP